MVVAGQADVAIQSFANLATERAPGVRVAAVPMRGDPRDALVTQNGRAFTYLPTGARIGTASQRCSAQALRRRSDVKVALIRGNVQARLRQLEDGQVEALVLPAADLAWLGLLDRVAEYFDSDLMIPAPGQGALALEVAENNDRAARYVAPLHDAATAYAVNAERSCLRRLGTDNQAPVGIHAVTDGQDMAIIGIVAWADGTRAARMRWSGPCRAAEEVGSILADLLNAAGAGEILSGRHIPPTVRYATRRAELIRDWEEANPGEEESRDGRRRRDD